jgi:hypothetical protein
MLQLLVVFKVASAMEEPIFISPQSPAPPATSAEARIKLRQHRQASALNRFTFPGNVLHGSGDIVEHWIVMFCPGWHDKCQSLLPSFELLGVQWEDKLNIALMSSTVRFAKVDCATEKALCVSLDIDEYPSVIHYRHQKRVNSWLGGAPGLVRWIKQELEPPKRRASHQKRPLAAAQRPVPEEAIEERKFAEGASCRVGAASGSTEKSSSWQWEVVRSVCFFTLLLAVALRCWTLLAHACSRANVVERRSPVLLHGRKISAECTRAADSLR